METSLSNNFAINIRDINKTLNVDQNFDIIYRVITIAGREACFYMIDGLNKDEILEKILEFFYGIQVEDMPEDAHGFSKLLVPYGEVDLVDEVSKIVTNVLSGVPVLLVNGYDKAIAIDFRTYPVRGIGEPESDKVMRGARDGFVETIVFNTALIRRRIRNPHLTMEYSSVGKSSKTDVVLCYMNDRVDQNFLTRMRERINGIQVDALTMSTETLAEFLYKGKWFNPFPKFKYTERPDTAAATVLEGSIVVLVDNSPVAMILPTTLFEIVEEADDYSFPPITGTYLRLSRFLVNFVALFMTPTWILLMYNPEWIPGGLEFIKINDPIHVPLVIQLLLLEFAIDGLKLASMNTPSMLSTPLSVVAGIVLGDFTVSSGWFNAETMLYMAFVAIANYSQASYELGYALKFLRILMLLLTGVFNVWGYVIGVLVTIGSIVFNKTISGQSYIYPLIPFNGRELIRRIFRIAAPTVAKERK